MHEGNSGLLLHFGWKQKFPLALFQVAQIQGNSARVLIVHPLGIKTLIYSPVACNCLSIIHSSARLAELHCQVRSTVFKSGLLIARYMNHFELQFPSVNVDYYIYFPRLPQGWRASVCVFLAQCLAYRYSINVYYFVLQTSICNVALFLSLLCLYSLNFPLIFIRLCQLFSSLTAEQFCQSLVMVELLKIYENIISIHNWIYFMCLFVVRSKRVWRVILSLPFTITYRFHFPLLMTVFLTTLSYNLLSFQKVPQMTQLFKINHILTNKYLIM